MKKTNINKLLKLIQNKAKLSQSKIETIKNNSSSIKEFRNRDFSEFCEYVVAFKLQELGWEVYQPLSDRYIDIVAFREVNGKSIIRTIQVKASRLEKEGAQLSYGLTHKPKDLMHDPAHFFI
jgi:glutamate/tyrosine decarboxylase-like PLP-dependent enzyme